MMKILKEDVDYSLLVQRLGLLVDELSCRCQQVFRMSREEGMTNAQSALVDFAPLGQISLPYYLPISN